MFKIFNKVKSLLKAKVGLVTGNYYKGVKEKKTEKDRKMGKF